MPRCRTPACLSRSVCPVQLTTVSRAVGHRPVVAAAEEMEAYRLKRARADDPLAAMGGSGSKGYDLV